MFWVEAGDLLAFAGVCGSRGF